MITNHHFRWLGIMILLLLAATPVLAEPNRSWDVLVQSLEPGKTVVVKRMNSAQLEGKLLGITADSITIQWHGQPNTVSRDDVFRVRIANIRRRHTLIGMAIGAATCATTAAIAADRSTSYVGWGIALAAGMGTGIGAAVGGALPIGEPLYEAARPRPAPADRIP